jgi:hypothetical protein
MRQFLSIIVTSTRLFSPVSQYLFFNIEEKIFVLPSQFWLKSNLAHMGRNNRQKKTKWVPLDLNAGDARSTTISSPFQKKLPSTLLVPSSLQTQSQAAPSLASIMSEQAAELDLKKPSVPLFKKNKIYSLPVGAHPILLELYSFYVEYFGPKSNSESNTLIRADDEVDREGNKFSSKKARTLLPYSTVFTKLINNVQTMLAEAKAKNASDSSDKILLDEFCLVDRPMLPSFESADANVDSLGRWYRDYAFDRCGVWTDGFYCADDLHSTCYVWLPLSFYNEADGCIHSRMRGQVVKAVGECRFPTECFFSPITVLLDIILAAMGSTARLFSMMGSSDYYCTMDSVRALCDLLDDFLCLSPSPSKTLSTGLHGQYGTRLRILHHLLGTIQANQSFARFSSTSDGINMTSQFPLMIIDNLLKTLVRHGAPIKITFTDMMRDKCFFLNEAVMLAAAHNRIFGNTDDLTVFDTATKQYADHLKKARACSWNALREVSRALHERNTILHVFDTASTQEFLKMILASDDLAIDYEIWCWLVIECCFIKPSHVKFLLEQLGPKIVTWEYPFEKLKNETYLPSGGRFMSHMNLQVWLRWMAFEEAGNKLAQTYYERFGVSFYELVLQNEMMANQADLFFDEYQFNYLIQRMKGPFSYACEQVVNYKQTYDEHYLSLEAFFETLKLFKCPLGRVHHAGFENLTDRTLFSSIWTCGGLKSTPPHRMEHITSFINFLISGQDVKITASDWKIIRSYCVGGGVPLQEQQFPDQKTWHKWVALNGRPSQNISSNSLRLEWYQYADSLTNNGRSSDAAPSNAGAPHHQQREATPSNSGNTRRRKEAIPSNTSAPHHQKRESGARYAKRNAK